MCPIAGRTLGLSLDDDPTSAVEGDGPHLLAEPATGADGGASATVSTVGWAPGVYTLTVSAPAVDGCRAASDQAVITLGTSGDVANGAGWYPLPGSGRVNFGFTVSKVPDSRPATYRGKVMIVNNEKWRFKGELTKYVKPSTTSGSADGVGTLYRWDAAAADGEGDWVLEKSGVTLNIRFSDAAGQRRSSDRFGTRIAYSAEPSAAQLRPGRHTGRQRDSPVAPGNSRLAAREPHQGSRAAPL